MCFYSQICLLEIDVQGAEKIHAKLPGQFNYIFVNAPSLEIVKQRMEGRGTETAEVVEKRMKNAVTEIAKFKELGFFTEIVNDDLEEAMLNFRKLLASLYPTVAW